MSVFILKVIACFIMLLDHIGAVLGSDGWGIINADISIYLRGIGRISYPIFAFLIVNGWRYTKNKYQYFSRMLLFSGLSQIPYTLALYTVNTMKITSDENQFYFNSVFFENWYIYALIFISYLYFVWRNRKNASVISLLSAVVISSLYIKIDFMWIIISELNVFYTLSIGIILILFLEYIAEIKLKYWYNYIILIPTIILILISFGSKCDYGIPGILLIVVLYIFREKKFLQAITICIWSFAFYGITYNNYYNATMAAFSVIFIILYNKKKGLNFKYSFYAFYPVHLLILGMINWLLRI